MGLIDYLMSCYGFDKLLPTDDRVQTISSCKCRLFLPWKHPIDRKELVTILSTDMSKAFHSMSQSSHQEAQGIWVH